MSIGDQQFSETYEGHGLVDSSPFVAQVDEKFIPEGQDGEGNFSHYEITFNQAYVIDSAHDGDLLSRANAFTTADQVGGTNVDQDVQTVERTQGSRILNMSHPFEHRLPEDAESWPLVNYGVEVIYNLDNLMVRSATFTGITGADLRGNQYFPEEGDYAGPIFADEDNRELYEKEGTYQGWVTGFFPVCKIAGSQIITFTLRDNLHLSERQIKAELSDVTGCMDIEQRYATEVARRLEAETDPTVSPTWGGTGQAMLLMRQGNQTQAETQGQVEPEGDIADMDFKPITWRGLIAGSGIAVSPYLDSIVIDATAGGDGVPWSGENCGRGGSNPPNNDATWAVPDGQGAGKSKAKNVYKAYTAAQDGTHADPAIFRRLSGAGTVDVDYDAGNECIIRISGGLADDVPWSGQNCGTDANYEGKAYNVYKAYTAPQDGTHDHPAIFRRLSGDGSVTVKYDTDNCLIQISGDSGCCSGVENAGDYPTTDDEGARVYQGGNDPALLRRLVGAGLLGDTAGNSIVKESRLVTPLDDNSIILSGIWSGRNIDESKGLPVYKPNRNGGDINDGSQYNPALFRTLKGAGSVTITSRQFDQYLEISGTESSSETAMWTGHNTGDCGTYVADIYVENTGPDHDNAALFRRVAGGSNLGGTSLPVQGEITVFENGDCVGIRGNGKDGYLEIPKRLQADAYGTLSAPEGYFKLEWKDGLITTAFEGKMELNAP